MNAGDWLKKAHQRLAAHRETASLEAQALLAETLGKPRAWVLAHPEAVLSSTHQATLEMKLRRLEQGEPLPYILGHWEFYGLDFAVTPDVLIPRPETELLVSHALGWLDKMASTPAPIHAIDVGAGSGCIAVVLAKHQPRLQITAVDFSWSALLVARQNIARHQVENQVSLVNGDLMTCFSKGGIFELICANLPYIPSDRLPSLAVSRHEPTAALDGGVKGFQLIERLVWQSQARLTDRGLLLIEIDHTQRDLVMALAKQVFPDAETIIYSDLSGAARLVSIQRNPA